MAQDTTQDLKHAALVKRLLMYGFATPSNADIPLGDVRTYYSLSPNPIPISVGVNSMNRNPFH